MKWNKIRGKKFYIVAFTCAGVLLSGCVQSLAWSIPGVTKPYDPANYWTHDTISWPDSAPSIYALRDIAKNCGQVIDYQNLKPNTIKDMKAVADFAKRLEELMTDMKNLTQLGGEATDNFRKYLRTVQQDSDAVDEVTESNMYLADGSESTTVQLEAKGKDNKYLYLDGVYRNTFQDAKNTMQSYETRAALLGETVQQIDVTEGRLAAGQAQAEVGAITAVEFRQRNDLMSQRSALIALHARAENDEIIRAETTMRKKLEMQFADPYHPNAYDKAVYEKTEAKGIPNFPK